MIIKKLFLVALGGGLGSVARFSISLLLRTNQFFIATLIVNLVGSFLIGFIMAISLTKSNFDNWRLLLATGVCGGFTTFSAFSWECLQLFQQQKYLIAFSYMIVSFIVGIGATYLGFSLIK